MGNVYLNTDDECRVNLEGEKVKIGLKSSVEFYCTLKTSTDKICIETILFALRKNYLPYSGHGNAAIKHFHEDLFQFGSASFTFNSKILK